MKHVRGNSKKALVVIMKNLYILLENPKYAGNIGMVCRLIANFDLPPLRIIGEQRELHFEMEWMAYNSKEELDKIQYFSNPKESRVDLDLLIGTAMIQGKDRVGFIPLASLSEKIQSHTEKKIGIVFGREDRGLSNTAIDTCDYMIDFELSERQPSMNLSQSVSFVLGCIHSKASKNANLPKPEQIDKGNFYKYAKEVFELIEMNQFHGRENLAIKRFKKIIDSSSISREDLNFLYKLFQKIEFKIKNETRD
jgi:TrmH family RNA methyltransferase